MTSSYSTDLKLELMVTGENPGTWGDKTNTNLNLIQQAVAGYQSIALTSTNTTLSMTNATISDARNAVIEFTGTLAANATVYVQSGIEKTYTIKNSTTGAFTLALNQVAGASVIWGTTEKNIKGIYLDGTNANTIDLSTLGGAISTSASIGDFVIGPNELDTSAVTSVKIASFAVTSAKLDTSSVTSVKVASFAITSAALDTASVTSVKIASGAVGSTQLANTNVTAGSYTAASITVDAQGRLTAASSGTAGGGTYQPTLLVFGPTSGTYSASPGANRVGAYMWGGGGGGAANAPGGAMVNTGGNGGFGFFTTTISLPFASKPYSVGGAANAGSAGGNTNITGIGTANGGGSGSMGGPMGNSGTAGTPGTAPGAYFTSPTSTNASFLVGPGPTGSGFGIGAPANFGGGGTAAISGGALLVFENTGT